MPQILLQHPVQNDEYTQKASRYFDVPFSDKSEVVIQNNITLPESWNIGLIHGPSGSGKSQLLKTFGESKQHLWDSSKSLISNFAPLDFEIASKCLCAVGLGSIPSWFRPYHILSTGEKFRADLARTLLLDEPIILVDEFTSVVDRTVAKSTSFAVAKWIKNSGKKVIFASCHSDILEWLAPDWHYNPIEGVMRSERFLRPPINLRIFRAKYEAWDYFKGHHYLSAELNKAAKLFVATWDGEPVACIAILALPNPYLKNAWRGSRTVVLPEWQGLGIGAWLSDYFGSLIKTGGGRYFSKTAHPAMIAYRAKNPAKWRETAHSGESRSPKNKSMLKKNWIVTERACRAYEYVGECSSIEEAELFWAKV